MKECNENNLGNNVQFSSDYSMQIYASGCYYLDDHHHWQSDGLTVSEHNAKIKVYII